MTPDVDLGAYCRAIEAHLCRVNGGHLIRVVGVAFDLAKRWHADGLPLKIVMRGIDRRAERAARSMTAGRRPLRLEFCEADVADVLDQWRRAIGFALHAPSGAAPSPATEEGEDGAAAAPRPTSLPRHLERVAVRLSSFLATHGGPPVLRARAEAMLSDVESLRRQAQGARGQARDAVLARLEALDEALLDALPDEAPAEVLAAARAEARQDLAAYADRMPAVEYARLEDAAARRMARDRLGLPRLSLT